MKKLLIIGTLTAMSFSVFADSCQLLQDQKERLLTCQESVTQTNTDTDGLRVNLSTLRDQLSRRADDRRERKLNECTDKNTRLTNRADAIVAVNKSARESVKTLEDHRSDIASRVGGNKLIKSIECVAIDPQEGNSVIRGGRFNGKSAIFMGEGANESVARAAVTSSARNQGYLDRDGRKKRKRLERATRCFPVFAKNKADRALTAVKNIMAEAKEVKLPALPTQGRGATTTTTPRDSDSDRGGRGRGRGNGRRNRG